MTQSYAEFKKKKLSEFDELSVRELIKHMPFCGVFDGERCTCGWQIAHDWFSAALDEATHAMREEEPKANIKKLDTITGFRSFPEGDVDDIPRLAHKLNEVIDYLNH